MLPVTYFVHALFSWELLGIGVSTLLTAGFALVTDVRTFKAARVCFILAAAWLIGKVAVWGIFTSERLSVRVSVTALVCAAVGVGLVETVRLASSREATVARTEPDQGSNKPTLGAVGHAEKEFTTRTPKELLAFYRNVTPLQADSLIAPFKGLWIEVEGKVETVVDAGDGGAQVTLTDIDGARCACTFRRQWRGALSRLSKNDKIHASGKISDGQNGGTLYLTDCDLLQPSAGQPEKDRAPAAVVAPLSAGVRASDSARSGWRQRSSRVQTAPDRFECWLTGRSWPPSSRPIGGDGTVVGDSLILGSAPTKIGYKMSLVEVAPLSETERYVKGYGAQYDSRRRELAKLKGKKGSVTLYGPPLTDDPILRIEWQQVSYPQARAFHELVESDMGAWNHYRTPSLVTDPRTVPNIMATHNVMILSKHLPVPQLILAHRKKGARIGGYYNNRWSVSFEEQFSPVRSERDGRIFPSDPDLYSTALRGAKEEFLGEHFEGPCAVRIHAVQIETLNFNFGFLGAVTLRDMSFEDFVTGWHNPDAIDRAEHDAVLAIPCERNILEQCIEADRLPPQLWLNSLKSGRSDLERNDHLWHPTSKARLALCLWLLESGAI
jgi:hypothetical protein